MPSLKEVRTRIESVKSTQQITSAMKMVSASKLRKAQNAIIQLRPYANKLNEILQDIGANTESEIAEVYSEKRSGGKVLLVPVSSNRGLCGSFNSSIIKATSKLIAEDYKELYSEGKLDVYCIGKKVGEHFEKHFADITIASEITIFDDLNSVASAKITEKLMKFFKDKTYDQIIVLYNSFKNAAVQVLKQETFLPIQSKANKDSDIKTDYIFEPNKDDIITAILPKALRTDFFAMLLDSFAAEQGARMTSMHKATDNASELLRDLKLTYNKARQAAITNEILEIVGGAEALKG
ncbi:MAG: ATP synthase F1 subunit gamma [Hyphomicrobiales bacterium]